MCIGCGEALELVLPVLVLSALFIALGSFKRKQLLRKYRISSAQIFKLVKAKAS